MFKSKCFCILKESLLCNGDLWAWHTGFLLDALENAWSKKWYFGQALKNAVNPKDEVFRVNLRFYG